MKSLIFLFTGGLIVLLAACTATGEVEPASGDLLEVATVVARPSTTSTPTLTPIPPTTTPTPTVDPTVLTTTPWPPDPMPTPTPVPPFPGMVYTTDEGLWRINAQWQPELLFDRPGVLEPNGRRLFYEQDGDIWLADLDTGSQQNVTNSPDITECCLLWSPDGRYLLYQTDEGYFLTAPPEFTTKINVYLPPGARVLDWQALP